MKQAIRFLVMVAAGALAAGSIGFQGAQGSEANPYSLAAVSAPAREVMPELMAYATQLHQGGRWSAAYGRFMTAADAGNVDAARIVLTMYRYGPQLYRANWDATTEQLETWSRMTGEDPARVAGLAGARQW